MTWSDAGQFICIVLAGAATAVPLVLQLVKYVQKAVAERNWTRLLDLVLGLMEKAEGIFESGQQRKAYVMTAVKNLSESIGYEMDEDELSELIDSLCDMSKIVNAAK
ncbi:MAG: hypothetical protein IJY96_05955 [Oscillospiraceae bacterium]|nr:hypothetical protein [Oscillospiraceae bacterium]